MTKSSIQIQNVEATLINDKLENYDEKYNHGLEQYKLYVEMADRISSRRQNANSFFLSLNTAIIAIVSYLQQGNETTLSQNQYWLIAFVGIFVSYMWYRIIKSYRNLNSAKFEVIHQIEKVLPLKPYDAEWEALEHGKNPKLYLPFTKIEMCIPWIFFIIHLIALVTSIKF